MFNRCNDNNNATNGLNQSRSNVKKTVDNQRGKRMNSLSVVNENESRVAHTNFTPKQIEILKNSMCKGVSDEEFEVFLMACTKTQLDPFMKQIYAVPRKFRKPDGSYGNSITIQTGIDGYRLIAERTERYAPGPEPTYVHDDKGNLISATAYIKKQTKDGTWHTVSASAYLDEYMQTFADRQTGEKKPTGLWINMPKTMLAKCAEAQALRKAFPAEMSGVYTKEEMQQAEIEVVNQEVTLAASIEPPVNRPKFTAEQAFQLQAVINKCDPIYKKWFEERIEKQYKVTALTDLPADLYQVMMSTSLDKAEEYKKQMASQSDSFEEA